MFCGRKVSLLQCDEPDGFDIARAGHALLRHLRVERQRLLVGSRRERPVVAPLWQRSALLPVELRHDSRTSKRLRPNPRLLVERVSRRPRADLRQRDGRPIEQPRGRERVVGALRVLRGRRPMGLGRFGGRGGLERPARFMECKDIARKRLGRTVSPRTSPAPTLRLDHDVAAATRQRHRLSGQLLDFHLDVVEDRSNLCGPFAIGRPALDDVVREDAGTGACRPGPDGLDHGSCWRRLRSRDCRCSSGPHQRHEQRH